jgi:beta-glucanase (GH16 family)
MEFLSVEYNATSNPVNLVLQSAQSEQAGFNAAQTDTFQNHQLPFNPAGAFHEYRFDWSSDSVSFYADGALLDTMTQAVPTSPGHITLSHWSTGNPDWSAGPPTTDAILTVEYLKGYFNSSDPARQRDWAKRCKDPSAVNATCPIPEVTEAPNGNVSAKTFFFSLRKNETVNQTVSGTKKSEGSALELPWETRMAMSLVLLLSITGFAWFGL